MAWNGNGDKACSAFVLHMRSALLSSSKDMFYDLCAVRLAKYGKTGAAACRQRSQVRKRHSGSENKILRPLSPAAESPVRLLKRCHVVAWL